ncbi:putative pectinesterase/pectinesterase inhibitor 45 [Asparagus officinalis]|uniref:putative pectinesterase/pectinesterase inhibitor 45 n=1 Tax=Asparagus officinalis TaxID=4686 RepID=UPI00098E4CB7|nr:putative pectinesterase/pectinesterase inhibitor 45 [Asparagus officinalis]
MICTTTDYKSTCQKSLSKAVKSNDPDPKELVKAAISVIFDAIGAAFNRTQQIKTTDAQISGAMEDCRELFNSSKDELHASLNTIVDRGVDQIPEQADNIRTWLSAVMAYQQTCVDGFPKGELKAKMEEAMKQAREMTSNALAIVGDAAKYLGMLSGDGVIGRRLLEEEEEEAEAEEELPEWVPDGDRRMVKEGKYEVKLKANVTVAKDGSGQFKSISAALENMPKKYKGRYVIYVKPGVYDETVVVERNMENVTIYGDDPAKTIITGTKNFVDGTRTFQTATFAATFIIFYCKILGRPRINYGILSPITISRSVFLNCNMEGFQDTLYAQTHRQFYRGCVISGTVDFIFGDASAVFQNCLLLVRRPLDNQQNIVTAQGRIDRHENTGFVLHRCKILPDPSLKPVVKNVRSYLGRPWKENSRIVIMESEIGEVISPEGYTPWEGEFALKTLSYSEYKNSGAGGEVKGRVKWAGVRVIEKEDAELFAAGNFIQAGDWVKKTGAGVSVPIRLRLYD